MGTPQTMATRPGGADKPVHTQSLQANLDGYFVRVLQFDATRYAQRSAVQRAVELLAGVDERLSFRIDGPGDEVLNYSAERGWTGGAARAAAGAKR